MLDIDSVMFYLATIFGGSLKIKPHEASIGSRNYGQVVAVMISVISL